MTVANTSSRTTSKPTTPTVHVIVVTGKPQAAEESRKRLGADNVFDVYPDRSPFGPRPADVGGVYPANQIYIPYSIFSPFGFNGRYLYGRFAVNF